MKEKDTTFYKSPFPTGDLIAFVSNEVNSWLISNDKTHTLDPKKSLSKKYTEIDGLIKELSFLEDNNSCLEIKLRSLNEQYLQQLIRIKESVDLDKSKRPMEIIENFQLETKKVINDFQNNNPVNPKLLNILQKILIAIAKLMPGFIISKNTRMRFFKQNIILRNETLTKLEKAIQLKL